ncbi:MAG: alanine--tRNA ligase [Pseudomonadota bacterium]
MQTTSDIRSLFLDYFARYDHTVVASAPLVPYQDPTLLFVNAGMVPFKNVFTGKEKREYTRAASSQKCVRAGGKHNDLENVGRTARHHTFFEMLGNFSFGDYFKEQAIKLAWDLFDKELGIAKDRLLVSVYAEDEEAARFWKKIAGFSDDRIIRIATSDNFWSMGDTGPCGPCTEIFYDHGEDIPGGPPGSPDEDGDRFVEIWNLVFMQYEQLAGVDDTPGRRVNLPKPSIDTGMSLERLATVLQGVHDNYDIDLFQALIHASVECSGQTAKGQHAVSHRVIADHLRAASFLIADGVMPSNEGRGYVLRRIMRRAMRHAYLLGTKQPLMWQLVPVLISKMGTAYPGLTRAEALIKELLQLEEEKFRQTLGRGLKLLQEATEKLSSDAELPGSVAFKLYDTYGFPLDLTQDVLKNQGRQVDLEGFDKSMTRQREEARAAWSGSGAQEQEKIWFDLHERLGSTEFLGYDCVSAEGNVIALIKEGEEVKSAQVGDRLILLANQTPFYAESGGQMGDTGVFETEQGAVVEIEDCVQKFGRLHAHIAKVTNGSIAIDDVVTMHVDINRRDRLRANHSATHLLHAALRKQLGEQVIQKGSLVAPDRLRFDFSFQRPLTTDEKRSIEDEVNKRVRDNTGVDTRLMSPDQAQEMGAMALFGEKYDTQVRVVSMGQDTGEQTYSMELCGGTHVRRTGDIGTFKIINETSIASGIRRIEALTGQAAIDYINDREELLQQTAAELKVAPRQLLERVETLIQERKAFEQQIRSLKQTLATGGDSKSDTIQDIDGVKFLHRHVKDMASKDLRSSVDQIKKDLGSGIVMITTENDGKVGIVAGVTSDLVDRFDAVVLVRIASKVLGGKGGGGRADFAQAGGMDASKIEAAVAAVIAALRK